MTANKPEVVAWLHSIRQESDVITDKMRHVWGTPLGSMAQYTEALIRLSDYESLQDDYEKLRKYLQMLIDQTTPLVPDPDRPEWSRRIKLDEVIAERDQLRAECEQLRKDADQYRRLIELGEDFQWENIIRIDIEDFPSRAAAIDAAMQGRQP